MSTSGDVFDRLNAALSGRYRVERELGQGGMATVYLADDLKHERKVAIKVLRPELAAVVGADRFLAEIKTTAALQHPNILPLFDSGEADAFLFYVMPYVAGESLRERLDREKQLRVADALELTRKVADALDYAHSKGVVHRDVKPANILISERGEPLVADFGIALAVSQAGGGRITETGLSLGTPHYMSPEQATGDRDVDPRSDVYALGCVLYEMLAGEPPFHAPTAQAVLARILTEPPRRVNELRRTVPPHVGAVLEQALEKLPADRFESAQEFVDALDDSGFTHTSLPTVHTSPRVEPAPAARPRAGPLVPALVTGLAVMTAVAAFGWLGRGGAPGGAGQGPPVRTILDLGDREFSGAALGEVVISPDGSRFAFAGVVEDGRNGIFHRTAGELDFALIPGTEGGGSFRDLTFSPDNQWIAYADGDGLMKVSLLGGRPTPVVPEGDLSPRLIDWSVDGTIVFWAGASDGTGVYRVADNGGTPVRLFGAPEWPDAFSPQLLPDGSAVLFTDPEAPRVAVYDLEADSARALVEGGFDATYVEDTGHLLYLDEGGGLWAVPFDPARLELDGEAKPVLQGVTTFGTDWGRYTVSRGGTVVFGRGGGGSSLDNEELLVVGFDGTETVLDLPPRPLGSVRWAPDGRRIVFDAARQSSSSETSDDHDIFTYDVELENAPRRLTNEGDNWAAVWSPDGRRVAFTSERDGTDGLDLFIRNVDDDLPPRLLLSLPEFQRITDWPEDSLLVVESGSRSSILLLRVSGDSATVTPYYEPDADVDDGVVSPDGTLMAYASDESSQDEVYIRAFPTPRAETIVSEGGGFHPVWSPSGDTLYYRCEGFTALCATEIQREPTASVVSRWRVMEWRYGSPDLHPDGDRLITVRTADEGAPEDSSADEPERHVVIHNWFGELRRIFGGGGG